MFQQSLFHTHILNFINLRDFLENNFSNTILDFFTADSFFYKILQP